MTIEEGLYTFLSTNVGVSALVSTSETVENESGATDMRGSFVDDQAWFHDAGGLVSAYAGTGNRLTVDDGTGTHAYGFIGEAGTGETLDTAIIDDDCADDDTGDWNAGDCTVAHDTEWYEITYVANTQYLYQTIAALTEGKLYKASFTVKDGTTAGVDCYISPGTGMATGEYSSDKITTTAAWVTHDLYFVPGAGVDTFSIKSVMVGAGDYEIKNISLAEVTEPNANAVHIYKEYSLTTEGWNTIGSGIDYNADTDWDFDVTTVVNARIYPGTLPQNWTAPAISYQRISGSRFRNLAGPAGRATPRIQIDCWANSYSGAKTLATAVRSAMDGYAGLMGTTTVGSVVLESDMDFYESDTNVYRVSMDFWISHIET